MNIAYAGVYSSHQRIIIAGGENEQRLSKKVYLLQFQQETCTINIKMLPDLPLAFTNAALVAHSSSIYVAGSEPARALPIIFTF